ncbi:hypothetical protein [Deinococcus rubellus]|uniref:hypothetical protein n=1 Tax=Deinococcus rubellus TaxID=1889240 RepID=UPI0031E7A97E
MPSSQGQGRAVNHRPITSGSAGAWQGRSGQLSGAGAGLPAGEAVGGGGRILTG